MKAALNQRVDVDKTVKHEKTLFDCLTEDEQVNLAAEFAHLDDNQSGAVTTRQYMEGESEWHQRVYGREPTKEELREGALCTLYGPWEKSWGPSATLELKQFAFP